MNGSGNLNDKKILNKKKIVMKMGKKSSAYVIVPEVKAYRGKTSFPSSSSPGRMSHVAKVVAMMANNVPSPKCIPGQRRLPKPNMGFVAFFISESSPLNRSGLNSIGLGYISGSWSMYLAGLISHDISKTVKKKRTRHWAGQLFLLEDRTPDKRRLFEEREEGLGSRVSLDKRI